MPWIDDPFQDVSKEAEAEQDLGFLSGCSREEGFRVPFKGL